LGYLMLSFLAGRIVIIILLVAALAQADDIHRMVKQDQSSAIVKACRENRELLDSRDERGNTPLHLAAALNRLKIMRDLLALGASLEERNDQGMSPLGVAVYYGNFTAVKILVQRGANPGEKFWKYDNHSLPEIIALRGNVEIARYFHESGVDFLAYEKAGGSLISLAAFDRRVDMLEFLLEIGANPNGSKAGLAPLHLAIDQTKGIYLDDRARDFVEVLVKAGADVNALDDKGWSLMQRASASGQVDIVKTFIRAGAKNVRTRGCRKKPSTLAMENDHEELSEHLLRVEKLDK
jgi:ankyrin repeat protein